MWSRSPCGETLASQLCYSRTELREARTRTLFQCKVYWHTEKGHPISGGGHIHCERADQTLTWPTSCRAAWSDQTHCSSWQIGPKPSRTLQTAVPISLSRSWQTWGRVHYPTSGWSKTVCAIHPTRVAIPLFEPVKQELQRMENLGVIAKVEQPTEWCAGMVVVPNPNGKVRICVDLTRLNESVKRECHPLPVVDQTLAQLAGANVFTKLDANSGFWQILLAPSSALLTTFITPFGRFCFHWMPFGISSATEHFQRRMSETLSSLAGVMCMMDDVLVHLGTIKARPRSAVRASNHAQYAVNRKYGVA